MKVPLYIAIFIFFLFFSQYSNGFDLISQSCMVASKHDPNLNYDFCVTTLNEASCNKPPNNLEDLVGLSIQLTKSNGTNIISIISEQMKNQTYDQYMKGCLKDCFDLYNDSLSSLEDALAAFKSNDLDTANINVSAALDSSDTCEDQFKEKEGEISPLTKENHDYFQLNAISLGFIQMVRQN